MNCHFFHKKIATCAILLLLLLGTSRSMAQEFSFQEIFSHHPDLFDSVLANKKEYRLQIIYTQINRNKNGKPMLTNYTFDADSYYYYCASMVKLPASIFSLEKVHTLKANNINRFDSLLIDSFYCDDLNAENTAQQISPPTISQYIKEMLLVSNNYAFNPLYDFLGQQYFNDRLQQIGFHRAAIANRFSNCDTAENRVSNPITIYGNGQKKYHQDILSNPNPTYYHEKHSSLVGTAYVGSGGVIKRPKDFGYSNYIPLTDLHHLLEFVVFPKNAPFPIQLTDQDHDFLLHCMGMFPRESNRPVYDSAGFPDNYMKYFVDLGSENQFPTNLRIYNKVGQAYGFMTDCSYVADSLNDIDFFLSCSMYLNKDGVLNDGVYEYDAVGFPFFRNLFNTIYQYELQRKRKTKPPIFFPEFSEKEKTVSAPTVTSEEMENRLCALADSMWNERSIAILYDSNFSQRFHVALLATLNSSLGNYSFDKLRLHHIKMVTSHDGRLRTFQWSGGMAFPGDLIIQQTGIHPTAKSIREISLIPKSIPTQETQQIHFIEKDQYLLITSTNDCDQFVHAIQLNDRQLLPAYILSWQNQKAATLFVEQPGKKPIQYNEKKKQLRFPYHTKKQIKIATIYLKR